MLTRTLPVELNKDELRFRGLELAKLHGEVNGFEEKKKAFNDEVKDEISGRVKKMNELTKQLNSKQEWREVQIKEHSDYNAQEVITVRLDTGEEIDRRPMTPRELQRPIPFKNGDDDTRITLTHVNTGRSAETTDEGLRRAVEAMKTGTDGD